MNDTQRSEYVCTIQQRIARVARERPQEVFTSLNHYLDVQWLKAAYERVKPDSAPGIDGQSWADYGKDLEKNLLSLLNRVKSGSYVAPPVKRVRAVARSCCQRAGLKMLGRFRESTQKWRQGFMPIASEEDCRVYGASI